MHSPFKIDKITDFLKTKIGMVMPKQRVPAV